MSGQTQVMIPNLNTSLGVGLIYFKYSSIVLIRLVPFHIIDVGTKRSFILLIREGETACSAP